MTADLPSPFITLGSVGAATRNHRNNRIRTYLGHGGGNTSGRFRIRFKPAKKWKPPASAAADENRKFETLFSDDVVYERPPLRDITNNPAEFYSTNEVSRPHSASTIQTNHQPNASINHRIQFDSTPANKSPEIEVYDIVASNIDSNAYQVFSDLDLSPIKPVSCSKTRTTTDEWEIAQEYQIVGTIPNFDLLPAAEDNKIRATAECEIAQEYEMVDTNDIDKEKMPACEMDCASDILMADNQEQSFLVDGEWPAKSTMRRDFPVLMREMTHTEWLSQLPVPGTMDHDFS